MNFIINLVAKWSGFNWVWEKTDGVKSYLAGVATILTGAAGLIQDYLAATQAHNFATALTFIETANKDPNWLKMLAGFALIAAAHKAEKIIAATCSIPAAPVLPAASSRSVWRQRKAGICRMSTTSPAMAACVSV